MSVPLSDTHLAELRDLRFLDAAITESDRSAAAVAATRVLVREVDRLRALHGVYEAARLGNLIGLDEETTVAIRGALADSEASLRRYRSAWRSARNRAAVLSAEITRRVDGAVAIAEASMDGLVRCRRPHCPNAERFTFAADRGWARVVMDSWLCPEHAALAAAPTS